MSTSASAPPQQPGHPIPVPKQPTKAPAVPTMVIPPQMSAPYKLSNPSEAPFNPVPKQWLQSGEAQLPSIWQRSSQKPTEKEGLTACDDLQAALDDLFGDDIEAALDNLLGEENPRPEQANAKSKGLCTTTLYLSHLTVHCMKVKVKIQVKSAKSSANG